MARIVALLRARITADGVRDRDRRAGDDRAGRVGNGPRYGAGVALRTSRTSRHNQQDAGDSAKQLENSISLHLEGPLSLNSGRSRKAFNHLPAPSTPRPFADIGRANGEANASLNGSGVGITGRALERRERRGSAECREVPKNSR